MAPVPVHRCAILSLCGAGATGAADCRVRSEPSDFNAHFSVGPVDLCPGDLWPSLCRGFLVIMVFDFSCQEILNETIEELAELSLSLETLFESSYEDVVWFLRLVGGNVIMDHRDTFKDDLFSFHQGKRQCVS